MLSGPRAGAPPGGVPDGVFGPPATWPAGSGRRSRCRPGPDRSARPARPSGPRVDRCGSCAASPAGFLGHGADEFRLVLVLEVDLLAVEAMTYRRLWQRQRRVGENTGSSQLRRSTPGHAEHRGRCLLPFPGTAARQSRPRRPRCQKENSVRSPSAANTDLDQKFSGPRNGPRGRWHSRGAGPRPGACGPSCSPSAST